MTYNIPLPFTCRQAIFGLFGLVHVGLFASIYYATVSDSHLYFLPFVVFMGIAIGGWISALIIWEPLSFSCRCDK